jgi:hypothetical protein
VVERFEGGCDVDARFSRAPSCMVEYSLHATTMTNKARVWREVKGAVGNPNTIPPSCSLQIGNGKRSSAGPISLYISNDRTLLATI